MPDADLTKENLMPASVPPPSGRIGKPNNHRPLFLPSPCLFPLSVHGAHGLWPNILARDNPNDHIESIHKPSRTIDLMDFEHLKRGLSNRRLPPFGWEPKTLKNRRAVKEEVR